MGDDGTTLEGAVVPGEDVARTLRAGERIAPGVALAGSGFVRVTCERVAPENRLHERGHRLDAGGDKFGVLVGQALGGGPFADDLAGGGAPAFDARLPREAAGAVGEGGREGVGFGEEIQPVDRFADARDEARRKLRDEQPVGVLAREPTGVGDAVLAREPAAEAVLGGCHGSVQAERTPARRMASKARAPSPGWRSTARTASMRTKVAKPRSAASRAVSRTQ